MTGALVSNWRGEPSLSIGFESSIGSTERSVPLRSLR